MATAVQPAHKMPFNWSREVDRECARARERERVVSWSAGIKYRDRLYDAQRAANACTMRIIRFFSNFVFVFFFLFFCFSAVIWTLRTAHDILRIKMPVAKVIRKVFFKSEFYFLSVRNHIILFHLFVCFFFICTLESIRRRQLAFGVACVRKKIKTNAYYYWRCDMQLICINFVTIYDYCNLILWLRQHCVDQFKMRNAYEFTTKVLEEKSHFAASYRFFMHLR